MEWSGPSPEFMTGELKLVEQVSFCFRFTSERGKREKKSAWVEPRVSRGDTRRKRFMRSLCRE